jgi:hypothetical protein
MRVALLLAVLVAGCDLDLEPPRAPEAAVTKPEPVQAACFAVTNGVLDQAERALASGDASRASVIAHAADGPFRDEQRQCGNDEYERVRARRLALRHRALRMSNASDMDVLRDLGNESFETNNCTCGPEFAWFSNAFPNFVDVSGRIAIRAMDRLPITPQPDGRLTVEYMETVENRLALLEGDVFAMEIDPSTRRDARADVELRVDGADVIEGPERKHGAHVALLVPMSDAPSSGPVVLLVRRSDFRRQGSTWRAPGRLAFATR